MSESEPQSNPTSKDDSKAESLQHEKKDLADALQALSEGAAPSDSSLEDADDEGELLAEGFEFDPMTGRSLRPAVPEKSKPKPREAHREDPPAPVVREAIPTASPEPARKIDFEQIIETEELAVPAPSAEALASSTRLRGSRPAAPRNSALNVQRTIIPIFLTLAAICIGVGIWFLSLPMESILRSTAARLHVYLFIAAPILAIVAAINMVQVRAQLRKIASAS